MERPVKRPARTRSPPQAVRTVGDRWVRGIAEVMTARLRRSPAPRDHVPVEVSPLVLRSRTRCLGPSKVVGYEGMCGVPYDRGRDKDGRATEKVVRKWFPELQPECKAAKRLMS